MKDRSRVNPAAHFLCYLLAILLTLILTAVSLLGAALRLDTSAYIRTAESSLALQSARVDGVIRQLADTYHFDPAPISALIPPERLRAYNAEAVAWWQQLLSDDASLMPPVFTEPAIASLVREDAGFLEAVEPAMRRITAEDRIAYVICQTVQDAAIPVRTPVIRAILPQVTSRVDLTRLLSLASYACYGVLGALVLLPLLMLLLMRRRPVNALAYIGAAMISGALLVAAAIVLLNRVDLAGQAELVSPILAAELRTLGPIAGQVPCIAAAVLFIIGMALTVCRFVSASRRRSA